MTPGFQRLVIDGGRQVEGENEGRTKRGDIIMPQAGIRRVELIAIEALIALSVFAGAASAVTRSMGRFNRSMQHRLFSFARR